MLLQEAKDVGPAELIRPGAELIRLLGIQRAAEKIGGGNVQGACDFFVTIEHDVLSFFQTLQRLRGDAGQVCEIFAAKDLFQRRTLETRSPASLLNGVGTLFLCILAPSPPAPIIFYHLKG